MKLLVAAFFFFCAFFLSVSPVFAVSVTIVHYPPEITADPFTVTASVSGAASGTNYIRVDVYKEGTKNYFGETYNGSDWYGGSDGKEYFPLTVESGTIWSGDVLARIGDVDSTDYDGQGTYNLRIRRYTASGNAGSEDANDSAVSVSIRVPTQTPVPTRTPSPEPTNTPKPPPRATNTPAPVSTRTPTVTSAPTQPPTVTIKPTSTTTPTSDIVASASAVLGATDNQTKPSVKPLIVSLLLVGIGCAILSLVFVWKKRDACILEE